MVESLTIKTTRGVVWNGISLALRQGIGFVTTAILAHLLFPSDFGIIGMAGVFGAFITGINLLGFNLAIIQRKEVDNEHLSTAFWSILGMSIVIFSIIVVIAPPVAKFFKEPLVRPVMIVSSVGLIINSVGVIHYSCVCRALEFKKLAIISIISVVVYGIISIGLAIANFGVWSLVFAVLGSEAITTLLLWLFYPLRLSWLFRINKFKDLFGFGIRIVGSGILGSAQRNIDYLLIGKFLGAFPLGVYSLTYNLISFFPQKLASLITSVALPSFSKVQDENIKMREAYIKSVKYLSLVAFPLLFGLLCVAPEFVKVIYGAKWILCITPLQILCFTGLSYSLGSMRGTLILAKGRTDLYLKIHFAAFVLLTLFILIGIKWGLIGVAIAVSASAVIETIVFQIIANSLIELSMKEFTYSLRLPFLASAVMAFVLVSLRRLLLLNFNLSNWVLLLVLVVVGIIIYTLIIWYIGRKELSEIKLLLLGVREL